ncbi:hypothetical protein D6783_04605 [Candidatus Woesearchaeota archaeon]|nr:MAG: hypothetical protein D6783_04605 [Candidatus Woesearchaeota archaeon]
MIPFKLKKAFLRLLFERTSRLRLYIEVLDRHISIKNKNDREKLEQLTQHFKHVHARLIALRVFRDFFYLILYISFVSSILSKVRYFGVVQSIYQAIAELIGTTLSVIAILTLTRLINLHIGNLQSLSSHIIAIYIKHDKTKDDALIEEIRKIL